MRLTREIAELIVNTTYAQIPGKAVEIARSCFLDTIGVALAGAHEPASRMVQDYVKKSTSAGETSIIGSTLKVAPADGALVNGVIAHSLDYDDNCWAYIGHPSTVILPAILAIGEKVKASGKELIAAYVTGFEVACRIGSLVTPALSETGWHTTSTVGVFGAAAASGWLLKLTKDEMTHALGIATSASSGVKASFGTMTKPFHAGKSAHDGVTAALLAKSGFTSAEDALEHHYGFLRVLGNRRTAPSVRGHWGNPFAIISPGVVFKKYPSCTGTHPAVDATILLAEEHDIHPEDVAAISAGTTPEVPREVFYHSPKTGLEGKFSMEFCVSVALVARKLILSHFSEAYLNKPIIRGLMKKCRYYVAPKLTKKRGIFSPASLVEIVMKDGRKYSKRVDLAKGNPENPLSQEEMFGKFRECAGMRLSSEKVERLMDKIMHLEEIQDATELMALTH